MEARRLRLKSICREVRPDGIIVEHFPFCKWSLRDEILPMTQQIRQSNPKARSFCSVRDLLPRIDLWDTEEERETHVVVTLKSHFDALLIHSDPLFSRSNDDLPWAVEISVPSHYTGFICEEAPPVSEQSVLQTADNTGILVSAGGDGAEQLRWCSIEAWKLLRQSADFIPPDMTLVLPLFHHDAELRELRQLTEGTPIRIERYTPQFLNWLPSARLSISQAGYNTCMNLLRSRTHAILIPHPQPPDQRLRARRFAERGLATVPDHAERTGPSLAEAIRHALSQPAPQHNFDLNGAHRSCEIIDELLRQ